MPINGCTKRSPLRRVPALLVSVKLIVLDCTDSLNVAVTGDERATPVAAEVAYGWQRLAGLRRW